MAEATPYVIDARGVYIAPVGTALPAGPYTEGAEIDWDAAGWTKVDVSEEGIELSLATVSVQRKQLGYSSPVGQRARSRVDSIKWAGYDNSEASMLLVLPDGQLVDGAVTGGAAEAYYALAVDGHNVVWYVRKMGATGNLTQSWKNEAFTMTPYEYTAYDDETLAPGTPNYTRTKKVAA